MSSLGDLSQSIHFLSPSFNTGNIYSPGLLYREQQDNICEALCTLRKHYRNATYLLIYFCAIILSVVIHVLTLNFWRNYIYLVL